MTSVADDPPPRGRSRRPVVRPLDSLPPHVTMLCEVGDHQHCPGWVALPQILSGAAITRCACPDCSHPEITSISLPSASVKLALAETALIKGDGVNKPLSLPLLWNENKARLDKYHDLVDKQARLSFYGALIAMFAGFFLLVGTAWAVATTSTTAGSIVTGTLGVTATAFAAYISRTFVRSQETTASHLREYFKQPVEFSRYLAAERLLASFREAGQEVDTAEVLRAICSPEGGLPKGEG